MSDEIANAAPVMDDVPQALPDGGEAPFGGRDVLVVIPTLNEAGTLESVVRQLVDPHGSGRHRVIIVIADGGSTDGTFALALDLARTTPSIRLMDNPNRTQAAAMNRAVARFGVPGGIVVRCDAHAAYPPEFVDRLVESLERTGAHSVVIPMDSRGRECFGRAVAWVSDTKLGSGGSAHRGGRNSGWVDHGHHAAFLVDRYRGNDGGYDLTFTHNEDAEFDCRLRRRGGRIFLDADIRIDYYTRSTVSGLWRQYRGYGRGRSRTARRHPGSMRARQLAVPTVVTALATCLILSPFEPLLLALPLTYLTALVGTSVQLALRHRSMCGLGAGLAAATMHIGWAAGFVGGLVTIRERAWLPVGAPAGSADRPRVALVDPSLFTGPYDAGLDEGLVSIGVPTLWAVRPLRRGQQGDLSPDRCRPLFYRHVDDATWVPPRLRPALKAAAHLVGLARLVATIRRERIEIVHFQWNVLPIVDALAIRILRRRAVVVVTVHDATPFNGDRLPLLQRWGFDLPARLAHAVVVHTSRGKETLAARGVAADRIAVVPHGPLTLRAPLGEAAPMDVASDGRTTFTLFGQIKPYKGADLLIEALALLDPALRSGVRVIIAGARMMDTTALEQRIEALGLGGTVECRFGRLSEAEMDRLFNETQVFVFPYRQIDASGTYYLIRDRAPWIIASRVGVFAEDFIEGGDGRSVPPGDVPALAAAIAEAAGGCPRRPAGPRGVGWPTIAEQTLRVYGIAAGRAGR